MAYRNSGANQKIARLALDGEFSGLLEVVEVSSLFYAKNCKMCKT